MDKDLKKSIKLLVIHITIVVVLAGAAVFIGHNGITLWPCGIYELFGIYCLSCGSTRAAVALGRLDIITSVLHNPFPFLLVSFLLVVIVFESVCIVRKKRVKVEWLPWSVLVILGIEVVFCVLKNLHVIPEIIR